MDCLPLIINQNALQGNTAPLMDIVEQINAHARANYERINNMSLESHNKSQACQVQELINRERWYLSEQLGYDCTSTPTGICMLNNRVSVVITEGFGAMLADLPETEEI